MLGGSPSGLRYFKKKKKMPAEDFRICKGYRNKEDSRPLVCPVMNMGWELSVD
jgi:hypothetical protein